MMKRCGCKPAWSIAYRRGAAGAGARTELRACQAELEAQLLRMLEGGGYEAGHVPDRADAIVSGRGAAGVIASSQSPAFVDVGTSENIFNL